MTLTSSGIVCDVCGGYILLEDCKTILEDAADDWHKLPAGPLRRAFEVAHGETGE